MNTLIAPCFLLPCIALAGLLGTATSSSAQRQATAVGTQRGRDTLSQTATPITLTLQHSSAIQSPRVAMRRTGIPRLERHSLSVTRTGATYNESFMFATITGPIAQVTEDEVPQYVTNVSSQSDWVRNNTGTFYSADVDTGLPTATLTDTAQLGSVTRAGATFLARISFRDPAVQTNISGNNDLQGVRLALEAAADALADDIDRKAGANFMIRRAPIHFSPHDAGRKAIVFILTFEVRQPGFLWGSEHVATIFVPVSLIFSRNAAGDGYIVSVNPTDITNKDRLLVKVFKSTDGRALLNATRDAYSDLDAAFYNTARDRLQNAVTAARPVGVTAPADFDIILYPLSSTTTTKAKQQLALRILE